MPSPSHHPHDRFFRAAFSQLPVVKEYLSNFLPDKLASRLNLDSLQQVDASFLDKRLREHLSDIVYSCKYGEEKVNISLLFEHKSYRPAMPWLQLLRYLLNAYEAQRRDGPTNEKLKIVIPIVVYHGKESWELQPVSWDFEGVDELLAPFIPAFTYLLTDLSQYSEVQLVEMESNWIKHAFLALKLSREKQLFSKLRIILDAAVVNLENESQSNFFELIIVYLFQVYDLKEDLLEKINALETPLKSKVMTIYDSIYDDAIKKGALRKSFNVFKNGLARGIEMEDLIAITGITRKQALAWKKHIDTGGTDSDLFETSIKK